MNQERNYKLYVHIAPNGKRYYGLTKQKNPTKRWRSGHGYIKNKHFYRAIKKYGWNNIEHIVTHDNLTEHEAKLLEQYMIQWYDTANRKNGYNISLGGEGGNGCNRSEEHKRRISEANKGHVVSEEARERIREGNKGKIISEETRKKISEAGKGRPGKKGKDSSNSKSVICITTNQVFYSVMDVEREYGIKKQGVSQCCLGKQKSAGKTPDGEKMVWRFIEIIEL